MNAKQFFELVEQMRKAQKAYFNPKTRTQKALEKSRRLEKAVDLEITRVRSIIPQQQEPATQTNLFDEK